MRGGKYGLFAAVRTIPLPYERGGRVRRRPEWRILNRDSASGNVCDLFANRNHRVAEAVKFAEESPFPAPEALFEGIYVDN